jgi:hypothetical protein
VVTTEASLRDEDEDEELDDEVGSELTEGQRRPGRCDGTGNEDPECISTGDGCDDSDGGGCVDEGIWLGGGFAFGRA